MWLWLCLLLLLPLAAPVSATSDDTKIEYYNQLARKNLLRKLKDFKEMHDGRLPKNIILFIGDGMGISAVTAARLYKAEKMKKTGQYSEMPFFMEGFDSTGWSKTSAWDVHVTDSAAGAVGLLTGIKGPNYMLGVKPGGVDNCTKESAIEGENVAELAVLKGLSVGSVTTMSLTHATPAAVFAKAVTRDLESDKPNDKIKKYWPTCKGRDLALQLLDMPANKIKVLMGGGETYLLPNTTLHGERRDGRNVVDEWSRLEGKRKVVYSRDELMKLKADDKDLHVMGLFHHKKLPASIISTAADKAKTPKLWEMTQKSIEILSQNEKGYFLMVEGGQIDSYEHDKRIFIQSDELLEFDDAIKRAREMTNREETLIIVTADHSHTLMIGEFEKKTDKMTEVGREKKGIAFSHGGWQKMAKAKLRQNPLDTFYQFPAMFNNGKGRHGGDHVPIYSDGPYSWLFSSTIENTEVGYLMKSLLCLNKDYCLRNEDKGSQHRDAGNSTLCTVGIAAGVVFVGISLLQLVVILYWLHTKKDIKH